MGPRGSLSLWQKNGLRACSAEKIRIRRQLRSAPSLRDLPLRTAHESAVLATMAAAYDLAAKSGSISLRSHDLLRRLHRSASVLREAMVRVEAEVRSHPDDAAAADALALLDEVSLIGVFYDGSV